MFDITEKNKGFQVRFSATIQNVDIACKRLERVLIDSGLEELKFDMVLGAREVLNNSVIHGSGADSSLTVQFSVHIKANAIVMVVADEGPGFDYQTKTSKCELSETSGRGICILESYFDTVLYKPPGNQVELQKKIEKPEINGATRMTEISREGDTAVIKLGCDIISSNIEELRNEFKKAIQDGATRINLDLENVTYVDSMGLGLLVATHNSLQKTGQKLELSHVSGDIGKLLTQMRLDQHFSLV